MKKILLALALLTAASLAAWQIDARFCCTEDPPAVCPPFC